MRHSCSDICTFIVMIIDSIAGVPLQSHPEDGSVETIFCQLEVECCLPLMKKWKGVPLNFLLADLSV